MISLKEREYQAVDDNVDSSLSQYTAERREAVADALNKAIKRFAFSGKETFNEIMSGGLTIIAEAVGFDRVSIYSYKDTDKGKSLGQIYRWDKNADGFISLTEGLSLLPDNDVIKGFVRTLKEGRHIFKNPENVNQDEKEFLEQFGTRSAFIAPIFLENNFWGSVVFQDLREGLNFCEDCVDFLCSAAYLVAIKVVREEGERSLEQVEQQHKQHLKMLSALNQMDVVLLSQGSGNFDERMRNSLVPIAWAAELDRIIIYRVIDLDGQKRFGRAYHWERSQDGLISMSQNYSVMPDIPVLSNWLSIALGGGVINTCLSSASKEEKDVLETYGIKSYLMVPVLIDGEPWGAMTFQNHTGERIHDYNSVVMLKGVANICANAIIRNENIRSLNASTEMLSHREQMLRTLNKAAVLFLSQHTETFENAMTAGLNLVASILEIDRISVWRNTDRSPDGLSAEQIYLWDKIEGSSTEATRLSYAEYAPRWESLLKRGEYINSPVSLLPEAELLKSLGMVSVFVTPLIVNGTFWGFVTFADHKIVRYFSEDSADIMSSAALLCANTVIMNEKAVSERMAVKNLMHREMMLNEINKMAIAIISHEQESKHEEILSTGLKTIADEAGIDQIAIYKHVQEDGTENGAFFRQIYVWSGETIPLIKELMVMPKIPETARLVDMLKNDECIHEDTSQMGEVESTWFKQYGVLAVYAVPICMGDEFWGLVSFENHTAHRKFDESFLNPLQSVAHLCVDIIQRTDMEREIQHLEKEADKIYYDMLTGIYNRRFFDDEIKSVVSTLSRASGCLSLMMIDIDNFKQYNDTYGHSEGDKCLIKVAQELSRTITRASDFIARYGGEEFVAVMPNTNREGANMLAEEVLERIESLKIPHMTSSISDYVTVSIGVVTGTVSHTQSGNDYIIQADKMLYKSKNGGRNRYKSKDL